MQHSQGLVASIIGPFLLILRGIAGAAGGGWATTRAAWSFEGLAEKDDARVVREGYARARRL